MPSPISGPQPSGDSFPQTALPVERALHAFQNLYENVGAHDVAKLTGAILVLHQLAASAPQFDDHLTAIEEKLPQLSLENLPSLRFDIEHLPPLPNITHQQLHQTLSSVFDDVLLPLAQKLSVENEDAISHQFSGALVIAAELHPTDEMHHAIKAVQYDSALHEMFPTPNTKEMILRTLSDCKHLLENS